MDEEDIRQKREAEKRKNKEKAAIKLFDEQIIKLGISDSGK